jgi:hypothetical protein
MASISSEGSIESPLVEQEEIAALTHDVRNFKEALGKLRKIFHPDLTDRSKFVKIIKTLTIVVWFQVILCLYCYHDNALWDCLSHR